jgi:hypothetical protein
MERVWEGVHDLIYATSLTASAQFLSPLLKLRLRLERRSVLLPGAFNVLQLIVRGSSIFLLGCSNETVCNVE